jgi:hypothetical protein
MVPQSSAGTLRCVLDYGYSVFSGDRRCPEDVSRISVKVRNQDRINSAADHLSHRVEIRTQRRRVKVIKPHSHIGADYGRSEIRACVTG